MVTLTWIRDNYDTDKNRYISADELAVAEADWHDNKITMDQFAAVMNAKAGHILLPAYSSTPAPPSGTETRTVSLDEGNHEIQVIVTGYDQFKATINVSSTSVSCVSVVGGHCGGSGVPRVSTSGWTVTTYLKATSGTGNYSSWLAGKGGLDNITLSDIFDLKDKLVSLPSDLTFTPTMPEIMQCKDAFIGI